MMRGMDTDDPRLMASMEQVIEECKTIKYNPARLQIMLKRRGAVGALRILLDAAEPSDGFGTLLMKGRMDLTAEAIALRPEWQRYFTKPQRDRGEGAIGWNGVRPCRPVTVPRHWQGKTAAKEL